MRARDGPARIRTAGASMCATIQFIIANRDLTGGVWKSVILGGSGRVRARAERDIASADYRFFSECIFSSVGNLAHIVRFGCAAASVSSFRPSRRHSELTVPTSRRKLCCCWTIRSRFARVSPLTVSTTSPCCQTNSVTHFCHRAK